MTALSVNELTAIDGGWDWDDFLTGVSVGLATTAVVIATGGTGLVAEAAIIAWTGVGVSTLNLYL